MSTNERPLVTVVIPTHNGAAFLGDSVRGVLAQTYRRHEVIVVDDGSTDDTRGVLRTFGDTITYLYQAQQGPSAARNAGIRRARGEFICLLDADDSWSADKLALQTSYMEAHPEVGFLFADAEETEGSMILKSSILATMKFGADALSQRPLQAAFEKLLIENFVPTSTVMIRKSCLLRSGLFDETLGNAEDRDMWLRLAATTAVACVPRILASKRTHGANISTRTELALRSRIKVWNKARREWPELAPPALYQRMLAGAHQELGYIMLTRGERGAARRHGMTSLRHAMRCVIATRSSFPHPWGLGLMLVPLSLVPWRLVRSLWSARNYVLGRHLLPQIDSVHAK